VPSRPIHEQNDALLPFLLQELSSIRLRLQSQRDLHLRGYQLPYRENRMEAHQHELRDDQ